MTSAAIGEEIDEARKQAIIAELNAKATLDIVPHSFRTAHLIQNIIKNSIVFPREVVKWAQSLKVEHNSQMVRYRAVMRNWWKGNETALRGGDPRT